MASLSSPIYPEVYGWSTGSASAEEKHFIAPPNPSPSLPNMSLRHVSPPPESPFPSPEPPSRPRSATRSSRRKDDPGRVPRPRNSFFIFRCEFTRKHAAETKGSERSATPEKTLSRRAGVIWNKMSPSQKQVYRDLAKQESIAHMEKYPHYRYKPQRKKTTRRPKAGEVSRREQVESLVQMCESSAGRFVDSTYDPSQNGSISSSPEPISPTTPTDIERFTYHRSISLPQLDSTYPATTHPYTHTYFIKPESCSSSPGPDPHRNSRRSSLARRQSYSPRISATPSPDLAFDVQFGDDTVPFASLTPYSSTMSLPSLLSHLDLSILDDSSTVCSI
jgi:hypothetical protein